MTGQKDNSPNNKRKNEHITTNNNNNARAIQIPRTTISEEQQNDMLHLSLGRNGSRNHSRTAALSSSRPRSPVVVAAARPTKQKKNPNPNPRKSSSNPNPNNQSETIRPPFEWATDRHATIHTLEYLVSRGIHKIKGDVQCKRCERQYEMEFDLIEKFMEVSDFIYKHKGGMYQRAPDVWKTPILPTCRYCEQQNSAKPVIGSSMEAINWLFLLLGQLLGSCTLEQLKYFCKHTRIHRTGAKDRLLYLTYLSLCKQLDPNGPFDR